MSSELAAAPPSKWRSPGRQFLVVSGVSWAFEGCCGHQLEFVKIIKQTTMKPYPVIVREIVAQKGLAGFWDGFFPWGSLQAISKGAVFGWANALMRKGLRPLTDAGTFSESTSDTIAGAGAGGVQGFVLSPTLLLKTRVMTDPVFRERMGMLQTTIKSCEVGARVIAREGVLSLMKGAPTFAVKRVADWGSRYAFVNMFEDLVYRRGDVDRRRKLAYSQQVTAALVGGAVSAMVTVPLDVMVAQIQQASKAGQSVGVFATFQAQWKEGGLERIAGFATRGFVARCVHVAFTTLVIKTGTEFATEMLESRFQ